MGKTKTTLEQNRFNVNGKLIAPYPEGTRDPSEIQFNKQLSATRVKEECAFGIVKGQWHILSFIEEEV